MSDIKLFHIHDGTVIQIGGRSISLEKSLQTFIGDHLETFLSIRFLATEDSTSKTHGGRMDRSIEDLRNLRHLLGHRMMPPAFDPESLEICLSQNHSCRKCSLGRQNFQMACSGFDRWHWR
jgi:hypothetical protein